MQGDDRLHRYNSEKEIASEKQNYISKLTPIFFLLFLELLICDSRQNLENFVISFLHTVTFFQYT